MSNNSILVIEGGVIDGVVKIKTPFQDIQISDTVFNSNVLITPGYRHDRTMLSTTDVVFNGDAVISNVKARSLKDCSIGSGFRFVNSDLSETEFSNISLDKIDFINITWTKIGRRRPLIFFTILAFILGGLFCSLGYCYNLLTNILITECILITALLMVLLLIPKVLFRKTDGIYDEIILGDKKEINGLYIAPDLDEEKDLEEKYRQIATSYDSHRRFGIAGHFKAGEFEIRRQYAPWYERIWLWLYRFASFYGESIWKPIALILFTIGFPILLYSLGGVCWTQAFKISLASCFSFSSEIYNSLSIELCILSFFQKAFSYALIAQFLFALRRKVKR